MGVHQKRPLHLQRRLVLESLESRRLLASDLSLPNTDLESITLSSDNDSLSLATTVSPKFYQATGNVPITIEPQDGLLAMLSDAETESSTIALTGVDRISSHGGVIDQIDLATGQFRFVSAPGFTGTDTFGFTISDGDHTVQETATIEVTNTIWFVDQDASTNGNGTLDLPFESFTPLNRANLDVDQPGDIIYVAASDTPYELSRDRKAAGGFELEENQTLVGPHTSGPTLEAWLADRLEIIVAPHAPDLPPIGVEWSSDSLSTMANSRGDVLTIDDGNRISGIRLATSVGAGIVGKKATDLSVESLHVIRSGETKDDAIEFQSMLGTVLMTDVIVDANEQLQSRAAAISIDRGSADYLFSNVDIDQRGGTLLSVTKTESASIHFDHHSLHRLTDSEEPAVALIKNRDLTVILNHAAMSTETTASSPLLLKDNAGIASSLPMNDPPDFAIPAQIEVLEDSSAFWQLDFASQISSGLDPAESDQTLAFEIVSNSNPSLFAVQPRVSEDGTLAFELDPDQFGTAKLELQLSDDGGTEGGGNDTSDIKPFSINVLPVNDAPQFVIEGSINAVREGARTQSLSKFAAQIHAGPANESRQKVWFEITGNTNPNLFSVPPQFSTSGRLKYRPAPNAFGSAIVTVVMHDSGGTEQAGANISAPESFRIEILPVNDPPSFDLVKKVTSDLLAGSLRIPDVATNVFPGSSWESSQTVSLSVVGVSRPELFSMLPTIDDDGAIRFTAIEEGTAKVTVQAMDDGSVENGGRHSTTKQLTLKIVEMNQGPTLGPIDVGSAIEGTELNFVATATDPNLGDELSYRLSGAPKHASITKSGEFSWIPNEKQGGRVHQFDVVVNDGKSTDLQTLSIFVQEKNQPPIIRPVGQLSVNENQQLRFRAKATDPDDPGDVLSFSLSGDVPVGAQISTNGQFSWVPNESQGPETYEFNVVVSDGTQTASTPLSIIVRESNTTPLLHNVGEISINELETLEFTATAFDADLPAQSLVFALKGRVPDGASITPDGNFNWTPREDQGSNVYRFSVTVTDGIKSVSEDVTISVEKVYQTPILSEISGHDGSEILYSVLASNPNRDNLSFRLQGAPSGASITDSGQFVWTPRASQIGFHSFEVTTRDESGLTDTATISVRVYDSRLSKDSFGNMQFGVLSRYVPRNDSVEYELRGQFLLGHEDLSTDSRIYFKPPRGRYHLARRTAVLSEPSEGSSDFPVIAYSLVTPPIPNRGDFDRHIHGEWSILVDFDGDYRWFSENEEPSLDAKLSFNMRAGRIKVSPQVQVISPAPNSNHRPEDDITIAWDLDGSLDGLPSPGFEVVIQKDGETLAKQQLGPVARSATFHDLRHYGGLNASVYVYSIDQDFVSPPRLNQGFQGIRWSPADELPAEFQGGLTGLDSFGGFTTAGDLRSFTIDEPDFPPELEPIAEKSVIVTRKLAFSALATDQNTEQEFWFRLEGEPAGASISRDGEFTWEPSYGQEGTHTFDVVVYDNQTELEGADRQRVSVTVLRSNNSVKLFYQSRDTIDSYARSVRDARFELTIDDSRLTDATRVYVSAPHVISKYVEAKVVDGVATLDFSSTSIDRRIYTAVGEWKVWVDFNGVRLDEDDVGFWMNVQGEKSNQRQQLEAPKPNALLYSKNRQPHIQWDSTTTAEWDRISVFAGVDEERVEIDTNFGPFDDNAQAMLQEYVVPALPTSHNHFTIELESTHPDWLQVTSFRNLGRFEMLPIKEADLEYKVVRESTFRLDRDFTGEPKIDIEYTLDVYRFDDDSPQVNGEILVRLNDPRVNDSTRIGVKSGFWHGTRWFDAPQGIGTLQLVTDSAADTDFSKFQSLSESYFRFDIDFDGNGYFDTRDYAYHRLQALDGDLPGAATNLRVISDPSNEAAILAWQAAEQSEGQRVQIHGATTGGILEYVLLADELVSADTQTFEAPHLPTGQPLIGTVANVTHHDEYFLRDINDRRVRTSITINDHQTVRFQIEPPAIDVPPGNHQGMLNGGAAMTGGVEFELFGVKKVATFDASHYISNSDAQKQMLLGGEKRYWASSVDFEIGSQIRVQTWDVSLTNQQGPVEFGEAEIQFTYDASLIDSEHEPDLELYRWIESLGHWQPAPIVNHDIAGNTLTIQTDQLGIFVLGRPSQKDSLFESIQLEMTIPEEDESNLRLAIALDFNIHPAWPLSKLEWAQPDAPSQFHSNYVPSNQGILFFNLDRHDGSIDDLSGRWRFRFDVDANGYSPADGDEEIILDIDFSHVSSFSGMRPTVTHPNNARNTAIVDSESSIRWDGVSPDQYDHVSVTLDSRQGEPFLERIVPATQAELRLPNIQDGTAIQGSILAVKNYADSDLSIVHGSTDLSMRLTRQTDLKTEFVYVPERDFGDEVVDVQFVVARRETLRDRVLDAQVNIKVNELLANPDTTVRLKGPLDSDYRSLHGGGGSETAIYSSTRGFSKEKFLATLHGSYHLRIDLDGDLIDDADIHFELRVKEFEERDPLRSGSIFAGNSWALGLNDDRTMPIRWSGTNSPDFTHIEIRTVDADAPQSWAALENIVVPHPQQSVTTGPLPTNVQFQLSVGSVVVPELTIFQTDGSHSANLVFHSANASRSAPFSLPGATVTVPAGDSSGVVPSPGSPAEIAYELSGVSEIDAELFVEYQPFNAERSLIAMMFGSMEAYWRMREETFELSEVNQGWRIRLSNPDGDDVPATSLALTLAYDEPMITAGDEQDLVAIQWDATLNKFRYLNILARDLERNTITVETDLIHNIVLGSQVANTVPPFPAASGGASFFAGSDLSSRIDSFALAADNDPTPMMPTIPGTDPDEDAIQTIDFTSTDSLASGRGTERASKTFSHQVGRSDADIDPIGGNLNRSVRDPLGDWDAMLVAIANE